MHPAGFQGTGGNCLAVRVASCVFLQHIFQFSRERVLALGTEQYFFYVLLFIFVIFDSQNSEQFKGVKMK